MAEEGESIAARCPPGEFIWLTNVGSDWTALTGAMWWCVWTPGSNRACRKNADMSTHAKAKGWVYGVDLGRMLIDVLILSDDDI